MALDFVPGGKPTAEAVVAARLAAGLTQTEAARSVYLGHYTRWGDYEAGRGGMDAARYELFLVKHGLHPGYRACG